MATFKPEDNNWTKEILCRYYLHGICKYGDDCQYSHDIQTPPNMVCRYYQSGNCSYGDKCRYDHVKESKLRGKNIVESSGTSQARQSAPITSLSHDVDWVNAVEFVPGTQYSPRNTISYSSAVKGGLEVIEETQHSSSPKKIDEMCPYALNGECQNGENCAFVHGMLCDVCGLYILHPDDLNQQEKHKEECMEYCVEDMKESFKIAESRDAVCGICMEVVWEKPDHQKKFGILENCNHMFCLECIRKWRSAKAFKNSVVRACPECRVSSAFVTPSDTWVEDKEEKKKLIKGYKDHLSLKACRYFDQGRGKCPFGANCFYLHAYPDGTKQDRSQLQTKKVVGKNGRTRTIDPNSLWDFMTERDGNGVTSSIMELLQDDMDMFDVVYLFGEDFLLSEDDYDDLSPDVYDSDEFLVE